MCLDNGCSRDKSDCQTQYFWFRKRKANNEMALEKLKEGNVGGAVELFQVRLILPFSVISD